MGCGTSSAAVPRVKREPVPREVAPATLLTAPMDSVKRMQQATATAAPPGGAECPQQLEHDEELRNAQGTADEPPYGAEVAAKPEASLEGGELAVGEALARLEPQTEAASTLNHLWGRKRLQQWAGDNTSDLLGCRFVSSAEDQQRVESKLLGLRVVSSVEDQPVRGCDRSWFGC